VHHGRERSLTDRNAGDCDPTDPRGAEQLRAKAHTLPFPRHGAGVLIGLPFSATKVAAIFTGTLPVLIP
jgi:hypothetical protein